MLPVYLCSQSQKDNDIYKAIVSIFSERIGVYDIRVFYRTCDPDELIDRVKMHMLQSFYLLDFAERNIAIVNEIRKYDPRAYIGLVFENTDQLNEALNSQAEAISCIDKRHENYTDQIFKCIDRAYKLYTIVSEQHHGQLCLQLQGDGEGYVIPQRDIYKISAAIEEPHCVDVYTEMDIFPVRFTLDTIQRELGKTFVRCHRQHIVNLQHVISFNDLNIELDNGEIVPCSRRASAKIKF